jgi:hypothetical protein
MVVFKNFHSVDLITQLIFFFFFKYVTAISVRIQLIVMRQLIYVNTAEINFPNPYFSRDH